MNKEIHAEVVCPASHGAFRPEGPSESSPAPSVLGTVWG
jgi:hypothetical protein